MDLKKNKSDQIALSILAIVIAILLFVCVAALCRNHELMHKEEKMQDSIAYYKKEAALCKLLKLENKVQADYIKSLERECYPSRIHTITYDTMDFNQ